MKLTDTLRRPIICGWPLYRSVALWLACGALGLWVAACDDSYWKIDMPGFVPDAIAVQRVSQQDMATFCGNVTHRACTLRQTTPFPLARIYLGPEADNCTLRHELRHAAGWNHDGRDVYRDDCGEG